MAPYFDYLWPDRELTDAPVWRRDGARGFVTREMPEAVGEWAGDSRWPAFFPTALSIATTAHGGRTALERISGASIVNRFPLVMAISLCRENLSPRHHARRSFMSLLERSGHACIQFSTPGEALSGILRAVAEIPEESSDRRIAATELAVRAAQHGASPVFEESYLVYEGRLAEPSRDGTGQEIFASPWIDVGSHRVYFLEVTAIQLRADIAAGDTRIRWLSLPRWAPKATSRNSSYPLGNGRRRSSGRYEKGYTPHYEFPSSGTVGFEATGFDGGMAVKELPRQTAEQVEHDNDRARWPCFFPSSVGMITTWTDDGRANLMPCGSTTVISRHPLTIAPCVSYARINARYAPRATLDLIRRRGRFGCGVPFLHDDVVDAIRYAGNRSIDDDPDKMANAGLEIAAGGPSPVIGALPIHFDCEVTGEVRMGTHVMFLGEVRSIRVREEATPTHSLCWRPWAEVAARTGSSRSAPAVEMAHP